MSKSISFRLRFTLLIEDTPIGLTSPLPLSSGINRLTKISSIVRGSTNSVHSRLARVAKESQRFMLDFLKDLQASILLTPFASTPEGPQEPLDLNAAYRAISPFICWYRMAGTSSIDRNNTEPKLACCASGCLSASCSMICFDNGITPPQSSSFIVVGLQQR